MLRIDFAKNKSLKFKEMTGGKRMAKHLVYQFYAELKDYEPKIWRRFEINGEKTMAEFAYAIMILFEMQASHLFRIKQNNRDAMLKELQKHSLLNLLKDLKKSMLIQIYLKMYIMN